MNLSKNAINHLLLFNNLKKQPEGKPSPLSVNEADIPSELKKLIGECAGITASKIADR